MIDLIRGTRNLAGATVLALAIATPATATPVQWTLSLLPFTDGGTASGSFVYDADLNAYSAIDITTTPGTERSGAHYSQLSFGVTPSVQEVLFVADGTGADQTGADAFYMYFELPLTNAGGLIELFHDIETDCGNAACTTDAGVHGRVAPGDVVANASAVPEPASAALLIAGLAGLGIARRRSEKERL